MTSIDTLRDTFLHFMERGMNYAEALEQFDKDEFAAAAMQEVFQDEATRIPGKGWRTNDDRDLPGLMEFITRADYEEHDAEQMELAIELWTAGWTSELPCPEIQLGDDMDFWRKVQTMSLYWRAPSKRPGRPGRRYLSTQQAYNAMQKAQVA